MSFHEELYKYLTIKIQQHHGFKKVGSAGSCNNSIDKLLVVLFVSTMDMLDRNRGC